MDGALPGVAVGDIVLDAAGKRFRVQAPGVFEAIERVTMNDPRASGREYIYTVYATETGTQENGLPIGWTTIVRCINGHEACDLVDPTKLAEINGWAAAFGNWRHQPAPLAGNRLDRVTCRECGAEIDWPTRSTADR